MCETPGISIFQGWSPCDVEKRHHPEPFVKICVWCLESRQPGCFGLHKGLLNLIRQRGSLLWLICLIYGCDRNLSKYPLVVKKMNMPAAILVAAAFNVYTFNLKLDLTRSLSLGRANLARDYSRVVLELRTEAINLHRMFFSERIP
jgi:hypothetical protein